MALGRTECGRAGPNPHSFFIIYKTNLFAHVDLRTTSLFFFFFWHTEGGGEGGEQTLF